MANSFNTCDTAVTTTAGSVPTYFQRIALTSGDLTINTANVWTNLSNALDLSLTAKTGDIVEVGLSGQWTGGAVYSGIDAVSLVSASPVNNWSKGAAEGAGQMGVTGWGGVNGTVLSVGGSVARALVAGDISGGAVAIRFRAMTTAAVNKLLNANVNQPVIVWARNHG